MSQLEEDFLYWLRLFRLPEPTREFKFDSRRRFRWDFCWPSGLPGGVAVEIDGGQWQARGGRHAHDADRVKNNLGVLAGWRILRFSGEMLKADPAGCIEQVRRALEGEGT